MEPALAGELARQVWRHGGADRSAGQRTGALGHEHGRLVVGADQQWSARQPVDRLDESVEQCRLVRFPAGRELHLASEVPTGRRGGDALLRHGVDPHTGTAQCADHPDRAVMDRVVADPDEKDRQATVEGRGAVGRRSPCGR